MRTGTALVALSLLAGCAQSARVAVMPDDVRFIDHVSQSPPEVRTSAASVEPLAFSGRIEDVNTSLQNAPVRVPAALRRELDELRDCLLRGWPHPVPKPEVVVSSQLAPGGEAVPGKVTLYLGLLGTDGAVGGHAAFVMAHELSHVLLDHYDRVEFLDGQRQVANAFATAGILASIVAETRVQETGGGIRLAVADQASVQENVLVAIAALAASQIVLDGLLESSWSRDQELEADLLGLDLLVNGGVGRFFPADALLVQEDFDRQRLTQLEQFEAIAEYKMEQAVATRDLNVIANTFSEIFAEAFARGVGDLYAFADRPSLDAEDRIEAIEDYSRRVYVGVDPQSFVVQTACDVDGLQRAMDNRELKRTFASVLAASDVEQALLEGRMADAERLAREGTQGLVRDHPFTRLAAYKVARARNDTKGALNQLRAIRRDGDTPIGVYTLLAAEYLKAGQPTSAAGIIAEGKRYYPPDPFYPLELQTAFAEGAATRIERVTESCYASEYDEIPAACREINARRAQMVADAAGAPASGATGNAAADMGAQLEGIFDAMSNAGSGLLDQIGAR